MKSCDILGAKGYIVAEYLMTPYEWNYHSTNKSDIPMVVTW